MHCTVAYSNECADAEQAGGDTADETLPSPARLLTCATAGAGICVSDPVQSAPAAVRLTARPRQVQGPSSRPVAQAAVRETQRAGRR